MGRMKEQLKQEVIFCEDCQKDTEQDVWSDTDEEVGIIIYSRCSECGLEDADK